MVGESRNRRSLIYELYARLAEEYAAMYDYATLSRVMAGIGGRVLSDMLDEEHREELRHFRTIARLIQERNWAFPRFVDLHRYAYDPCLLHVSDPYNAEEVAKAVLVAEMCAVAVYTYTANLARLVGDPTTENVILDIISDERVHLNETARLLGKDYVEKADQFLEYLAQVSTHVDKHYSEWFEEYVRDRLGIWYSS